MHLFRSVCALFCTEQMSSFVQKQIRVCVCKSKLATAEMQIYISVCYMLFFLCACLFVISTCFRVLMVLSRSPFSFFFPSFFSFFLLYVNLFLCAQRRSAEACLGRYLSWKLSLLILFLIICVRAHAFFFVNILFQCVRRATQVTSGEKPRRILGCYISCVCVCVCVLVCFFFCLFPIICVCARVLFSFWVFSHNTHICLFLCTQGKTGHKR